MATTTTSPLDSLDGSDRIAARDALLRSGSSLLDGRRLRFRFPAPAYDPRPGSHRPYPAPAADPSASVEPLDRLQPRSIRPLPVALLTRIAPAPAPAAPAPAAPVYRLRPVEQDADPYADAASLMIERLDRDACSLLDLSGGRADTLRDGSPADYRCFRVNPDGSRTLLTRTARPARRQPVGSLDALLDSLDLLDLPTQADFD